MCATRRETDALCRQIDTALTLLQKDRLQDALIHLVIAVNAVSGQGGRSIKDWLARKTQLISMFLLGGRGFSNVRVPHFPIQGRLKKPDEFGTVSLQDALYHLFRNPLVHEAQLPPQIQDEPKPNRLPYYDGEKEVFHVHLQNLIAGLMVALLTQVPSECSSKISGSLSNYPLANFCGLSEKDALALLRAFFPEHPDMTGASLCFCKQIPSESEIQSSEE